MHETPETHERQREAVLEFVDRDDASLRWGDGAGDSSPCVVDELTCAADSCLEIEAARAPVQGRCSSVAVRQGGNAS